MRLVHAERAADVSGGPTLALGGRQLVKNAGFRKAEVAGRQMPVQEADLPRVKPVEGANLVDERHRGADLRVV